MKSASYSSSVHQSPEKAVSFRGSVTPRSTTLPSCLVASLLVVWLVLSACSEPEDVLEVASERAAPAEDVSTLPERPFPVPSGPHAVGLREIHWYDENRLDPLTSAPDDQRRVPARIWYPTEVDRQTENATYILSVDEFAGVPTIENAAHVRSNSYFDTPPAEGAFPVLVYHHGGGWPRMIGTAFGEELASHGYVVFSIGHDGFNQSTQRPDGSSTVADAAPFPEETGDLLKDALASWEFLETHHFPLWVQDSIFALDAIEELNDPASGDSLAGHLDLERIGMYGWSFGGATSIETMTLDERVKAAVDLDGQLFGQAAEVGTDRPFMLVKASEVGLPTSDDPEQQSRINEAIEELLGLVEQRENQLIEASTGPWHLIEIAGADHGTFSDLVHLTPVSTPLESEKSHTLISDLLREFFDLYLRKRASAAAGRAGGAPRRALRAARSGGWLTPSRSHRDSAELSWSRTGLRNWQTPWSTWEKARPRLARLASDQGQVGGKPRDEFRSSRLLA